MRKIAKLLLAASLLVLALAPGASGADVSPTWVTTIAHDPSGITTIRGQEILVSSDGARVFMLAGASTESGDLHMFVVALASDSGQKLWRREVGDHVLGFALSPDGRRLYVLTGTWKGPAHLIAVRAGTGTTVWTSSIVGAYQTGELAVGSDGTIYTATLVRTPKTHRTRASVSAHDPATGASMWRTVVGQGLRGFGPDSLTVSPDGMVLVGASADTTTTARCPRSSAAGLSAPDGTIAWLQIGVRMPGCGVVSGVTVAGSLALFTHYGTVSAGDQYDFTVVTARTISEGFVVWHDRFVDVSGFSTVVDPSGTTAVLTGWGGTYGNATIEQFSSVDGSVTRTVQVAMDINGAAFSPDGTTLYVVGNHYATDLSSYRAVVRGMDVATGAWLWKAVYRGALPNAGWGGVAMAPDGASMFITGDENNGIPGWTGGTKAHALAAAYAI